MSASITPSICRNCLAYCPILVTVENGRPVKVTGDPQAPAFDGYTCPKGRALPAQHNDPERLLQCLLSIPVMAIVPFAVIVWAVRNAAPTNLLRTGALAGLVAGGIGAMAYSLHCPNDSLPFVAFWYGGAIVFCALAGAALGPRLLRW